jgi:hypothetical protein
VPTIQSASRSEQIVRPVLPTSDGGSVILTSPWLSS